MCCFDKQSATVAANSPHHTPTSPLTTRAASKSSAAKSLSLCCSAPCSLSAARFTCSRCLSWRRRQLVCSTSTTLPQTHCLCLCLYLCRRQQQRTAVINFYGFSPLDEAEADSNTAQPAACMARVIPSRNQKSVPLPVVARDLPNRLSITLSIDSHAVASVVENKSKASLKRKRNKY